MVPAIVRALTLAGLKRRSTMAPQDVDGIESKAPGLVAGQCLDVQEEIYDQLRKRYLVDTLGQVMGAPSGYGTAPPPIALVGIPISGDLELVITVTSGGPVGTATFEWSKDGGQVQAVTGLLTAPTVALPGTGLVVSFPPGTYSADNVYTAATPVPRIVLRWIAAKVTPFLWERRGTNPGNDAQIATAAARAAKADEQIQQAANSKDGLFDLPLNADIGGSGITQGSPLAYTETSPYVWQRIQRCAGQQDDAQGFGDDS